jgi:hypothetical protein
MKESGEADRIAMEEAGEDGGSAGARADTGG